VSSATQGASRAESGPAQDERASRVIEGQDGRRYAFADHNCFACGGQNAIGMRLEIELGEGTARTEWRAGADYVGWEDKIHGGILATLLDEVMAWAPSSYDSWAVTAEMHLRYRAPANPGELLVAEARVTAWFGVRVGASSPRRMAASLAPLPLKSASSSSGMGCPSSSQPLVRAVNSDKRDRQLPHVTC